MHDKKNKNVFTLNKFILNDKERKEINHFYPNPYKTAIKSGELLKKTIQTLNNRINGMHSPKVAEQELLMQLMQNQQSKPNGRMQGG